MKGDFRIIPALERDPRLIAFAQTIIGRVILVAVFDFWLILNNHDFLLPALAVTLCAFAGRLRFQAVALSTLLLLLFDPFWFDRQLPELVAVKESVRHVDFLVLRYCTLVAVFVFSAVLIGCKSLFPEALPSRRPVAALLLFYALLLIIADRSILHGFGQVALWSFINALGAYFWFLCYALLGPKAKSQKPLWMELGTFHPLWSLTSVPLGKGSAYLLKVNAEDSQSLAITQIKGLKLLMWGMLLGVTLRGMGFVFHQLWHIPTFNEAFARQMAGLPYPWYICWLSLTSDFLLAVNGIAFDGCIFIACGRMAGFNMLRNTYKPLQSRTIAEFWNRYFYYFKELLVEMFFYPTFLRFFKSSRRLRVVFATFMAACVGNVLIHFMIFIKVVPEVGLWSAIVIFRTYGFYALLLAAGISVSQLLPAMRHPVEEKTWLKFLLPLKVALFFCMLHVFDYTADNRDLWKYSIGDRVDFLLHLFGLR